MWSASLKGVAKTEAYRVAGVDLVKSALVLESEDRREVDWQLRQ